MTRLIFKLIYQHLTPVLLLLVIFSTGLQSQNLERNEPGKILHGLEKLNTLGSVLYVAAHPDDENTRLLSYLANERKYRTVYLSLTRGDGGQNLIGKEQGEELGMIRTHELLEARKVDRAEQAFARCFDFGYSKGPEETFSFWNREEALADVVWAIRKFKPDVIINRFPTTGEGGHGHHTASAILALEAFRAAGDPLRFPEQLKYVKPWQAERIFLNSFNPRNQPASNFDGQIQLDVGGYNSLLGSSYGEMAAESRSMHKSQGFGVPRSRGAQTEYFKRLAGDTSVTEIFENINTSWGRVKNGEKIETLIGKTIREFDIKHPEKSVPALLQILGLIRSIDDPYWREVKEKETLDLIQQCLGLWFDANAREYYATPGSPVEVNLNVVARNSAGVTFRGFTLHQTDTATAMVLERNKPLNIRSAVRIPADAPFSNPYWLDKPHREGMFNVEDIRMRDLPVQGGFIQCSFHFSVNGENITYTLPVSYKWTDPVRGEVYRPFEILPPASLIPVDNLVFFTDQKPRKVAVRVKNLGEKLTGVLTLKLPEGWNASPLQTEVSLSEKDEEQTYEFSIIPPTTANHKVLSDSEIIYELKAGKTVYDQTVRRIEYDHIPYLVLLKPAATKLIKTFLNTKVKKIGYIEGAGDDVAKCLKQAGFDVEILDENKILKSDLSSYGAIITGIRAYNTVSAIGSFYDPLMKYVENGGNLIVQYNTFNFISNLKSEIGPFPFKITRGRVTDEKSEVRFLKPDHFLLNHPNKISLSDFDGWVQERGLYFADEYSTNYEAVISWNDTGEEPLNGGLIITKKGKGHFMYTGISFFRQLPAGVPGAYRLLTNMINAGTK